jgi:hypothetical protein
LRCRGGREKNQWRETSDYLHPGILKAPIRVEWLVGSVLAAVLVLGCVCSTLTSTADTLTPSAVGVSASKVSQQMAPALAIRRMAMISSVAS